MTRYGLVDYALILVLVTIVILASLMLYQSIGQITQHETITITVINKDVNIAQYDNCQTVNDMTTCTPVKTVTYLVFADNNEKFTTSQGLYELIRINKKHTFYVSGWVGYRRIDRVLE